MQRGGAELRVGFYWGKQRTSVWPKRGERSHPGATLPLSEAFLTLSTSHGFVMPGAERAVASAVTGEHHRAVGSHSSTRFTGRREGEGGGGRAALGGMMSALL